MTREVAEKLVDDLLDCCVDYERSEWTNRKYARQDYKEAREAVIVALVGQDK